MSTPFVLPVVAFFGRTFDEYIQMFALAESALRGVAILDCPSGPAAFVGAATARGLRVTGCDPLYSLSPDELHVRARSNINEAFAALERSSERINFRDPQKFKQDKYDALEQFMVDYRIGRGKRYVQAELPTLPFADRQFDMVLSSNFLFCYSGLQNGGILQTDEFDLPFHLKSVAELARVAKREIRMVPTHSMHQPPQRHPYLAATTAHLESLGFGVSLEPSPYDDGFAPLIDVLVARRLETDRPQ